MQVLINPRQSGKTTRILRMAEQEHAYIVCFNHEEAQRLWRIAREQKIRIPQPITWDEFRNGRYRGLGIKGFMIDNLDHCIQSMTTVEVKAATFDGPSCLPFKTMPCYAKIGPFGIWRPGWPDRIVPPVKRGRWWAWIGPFLIGRPDETW